MTDFVWPRPLRGFLPVLFFVLSGLGLRAQAPVITQQPATVTAVSGTSATPFQVSATGTGTLTYQWRRLGVPIPGATASTFQVPNARMADAGFYDVVVTDGVNSTVSQAGRLVVEPPSYPSTFRLDPGFDPQFEREGGTVLTSAMAPDGSYYLAGDFSRFAGLPRFALARLLPNGTTDASYAPDIRGGSVGLLALQPDGKLLISGWFKLVNGVSRNGLARLNADGSLDASFNPGVGFNNSITSMALQPDGRAVVGGYFSKFDGVPCNNVVRLTATGSLDSSFATGTGFNDWVTTLALQNDGAILVGGLFTTCQGLARGRVARLLPSGAIDPSFDPGAGFNSGVVELAVTATGQIVACGNFTEFAGTGRNRIARLTPSGALDLSFNPGSGFDSGVTDISVGADGKIVACGYFNSVNGLSRPLIAGLLADGSPDAGFSINPGWRPTSTAVAADGRVVVTGNFTVWAGTPASGFVRLTASGAVELQPSGDLRMPADDLWSAAPVEGGKWLVGGEFSHVDGLPRRGLARLNSDGSVDATFDATSRVFSSVRSIAVLGDGSILAGAALNGPWAYVHLTADGAGVPGGSSGSGFDVTGPTAMRVQPDGTLLCGGYVPTYDGAPANGLVRLSPAGVPVPGFSVGSGFSPLVVNSVTPLADGRMLVAGGFTSCNGNARGGLVRLSPAGALDPLFNAGTGFNSTIEATALQTDDRILVVGNFTAFSGTARPYVARLLADGTLDAGFAPGSAVQGAVRAVLPQADGRTVIAGDFNSGSESGPNFIARLTGSGAIDPSFVVFDISRSFVRAMHYTDDGRLLAIGPGAKRGGFFQSGLVMFRPDASPLPAVTYQPQNRTANAGDTVTFSVGATGDDLSFQWYKDGVAIGGATASTLTLSNVQWLDIGTYSVRISNAWSSITSVPATLGSSSAPATITTQPGVVTALSGTAASLSVVASGSGPLNYQWRRLAQPIAGATGSTLTLPTVKMADAGLYDVVVYNGLTPTVSQAGELVVEPTSYPTTLRLDPSFAPRFEALGGIVYSTAVLADGRYYAGGAFSTLAGVRRDHLARFLSDGSLDPAFNPVVTGESVRTLAVQNDGRVLIGGDFTHVAGVARKGIARLNVDGSLDPTFDPAGGFDGPVLTLAVQSDGKIVAGGNFTACNGNVRSRIARLAADGSLDATFAPGTGFNAAVNSLLVQPDGRVVVGGDFGTYAGSAAAAIVRLESGGARDPGFAGGGGFVGTVSSLVRQADGRIVAGGDFSSFNGTPRQRLARLNADGSIDSGFSPGSSFNGRVLSLFVLADGRILTGGAFADAGMPGNTGVALVQANGTIDPGFVSSGPSSVTTVQARADGRVIVGGSFSWWAGAAISGVVQLNANGTVAVRSAPGIFQLVDSVSSLAPVAGGKWLVGGWFQRVNGLDRQFIARINSDGTVDPTFDAGTRVNNSIQAIVVLGNGNLALGGQSALTCLTAAGGPVAGFSTGSGFGGGGVQTLAVQADGRIVVGGRFTNYDGTAASRIARLLPNGALDPEFSPGSGFGSGSSETLTSLVIQRDGAILAGGWFSAFNGVARRSIARLTAGGSLDLAFDPGSGFSNTITQLRQTADGRIVASGMFLSYNGFTRYRTARVLGDGSIDASFDPVGGFNNTTIAIVPQTDGKTVVSGYFDSFNSVARRYFVRLLDNGTLDTSFTAYDVIKEPTGPIHYTDDGRLLVAGTRGTRNGIAPRGLILLKPDASPVATITAQPTSQVAHGSGSVEFSVTATGEALRYQWYKDGVALVSANSPTLIINPVRSGDLGNYSVVVSNEWSTVTSTSATLSAPPAPVIASQPGYVTASSGTPASLSVAATGNNPLTYQWRKLGAPIPGATAPTFSVPAAAISDAAFYDVVVTDGISSATSNPGQIFVGPAIVPTVLRLDPSFAPFFETTLYVSVRHVAVSASGEVFAAGNFTTIAGARRGGIARFDGNLAVSPGFTPSVGGTVLGVSPLPGGDVLVFGSLTQVIGSYSTGLARCRADGSLDADFTGRTSVSGFVSAAVVQPDGKILVGGLFTTVQGIARPYLARLWPDGSLDNSFVPAAINNAVATLALQPDGKIVIGGNFTSVDFTTANRIARLNADGTRDALFVSGTGFDNQLQSLALQADGRIVAGGYFTTVGGVPSKYVARLTNTGAVDPTFSVGTGFDSVVNRVLPLPDGRLAVAGSFTSYNGTTGQNYVAVLTANGALDPSFAPSQRPATPASHLTLASDGGLLVSGGFTAVGATATSGLVRYSLADGGVAATTAPGIRSPGTVHVVAPGAAGTWYVGGIFSHLDGLPAGGIVRFRADGSRDPAFVATGVGGTVPSVDDIEVQGDGKVVLGGGFTTCNGVARNNLVRLEANGALDAGFSPSTDTSVSEVLTQSDGRLLLGGTFALVNGMPRSRVARLNADGTLDTSFNPGTGFGGSVNQLALQRDGRVLAAGNFTSFNGTSRNNIARLSATGALDPAFAVGTGFNSGARSIALSPAGRIFVAGGFTTYQGATAPAFVALNGDGSRDVNFVVPTTGGGVGYDFLPENDGRVVTFGSLTLSDGITTRQKFARLNPDGTLSSAFVVHDLTGTDQYRPRFMDDGGLLVPAVVANRAGLMLRGLARFKPDVAPALAINAQPLSQAVPLNATPTLFIGASSTDPLSFQWYRGDRGDTTNPVAGATGATLTTAPLTAWSRFWVRVSTSITSLDSDTAFVEVAGGTMTLGDWTNRPGVPANQRGALDTPAGDGVTNLLKFALGVKPLENAASRGPRPVLVPGLAEAPDALGVEFTRNAGAQKLRLALETSTDLAAWSEVAGELEVLGADPDGTQLVRLREAAPPAGSVKRFARLKVELLP